MSSSTIPTSGISRKQRRNARQVLELQNRSDNIIPAAAFHRLINETVQNASDNTLCVSKQARAALQAASESYLHEVMHGASRFCRHANRDTLQCSDVQAYMRLQNGGI